MKTWGISAQWSAQFSSVQSLSHGRLFVTSWITPHLTSLSTTNSHSLLKPRSIETLRPFNHLILCPLLLFLPTIPPSFRVFANESTVCMWWLKFWSFSFSIGPSKVLPGVIAFTVDWLDLLAFQKHLNSLLQRQSSKASIFQHAAVNTVQLSHPYMTTGKSIGARPTFVEWSWHPISSFLSLSISHSNTQNFIRSLDFWCPLQGRLRSLRMETEGWGRMCHQMVHKHLNIFFGQPNSI